MPKLIIYVPAGLARDLEAAGLGPDAQRETALFALRELLRSGKIEVNAITDEKGTIVGMAGAPVQADSQPRDIPARTVDPHFKPDPKGGRK